jgi:hypothetical protein
VPGGSPRPPSALLVAPTCPTRVRGYSGAQPPSGYVRASVRVGHWFIGRRNRASSPSTWSGKSAAGPIGEVSVSSPIGLYARSCLDSGHG